MNKAKLAEIKTQHKMEETAAKKETSKTKSPCQSPTNTSTRSQSGSLGGEKRVVWQR